eukprot:sb/3462628/
MAKMGETLPYKLNPARCDDRDGDGNGEWTVDNIKCVPITCPPVQDYNGDGHLILSPSTAEQREMELVIGTKLIWSCGTCHYMEREEYSEMECILRDDKKYGVWSNRHTERRCKAIYCDVEPIENGKAQSSWKEKCAKEVNYNCKDSTYELVGGGETVRCGESGQLDGTIPAGCRKKECPDIITEHHDSTLIMTYYDADYTQLQTPSFTLDSRVEFDCETGWELENRDADYMECVQGGDGAAKWSREITKCVDKCLDVGPDPIEHGVYTPSTGPVRSVTCETCYKPTNSKTQVVCNSGKWEPPHSADCERIRCTSPGKGTAVRQKSETYKDPYHCHDEVEYYCENENYVMSGDAKRICQNDGTWSGIAPMCQYIACPELPKIANGVKDMNEAATVVDYECETGYAMYGDGSSGDDNVNSRRVCTKGQWSGTAITCKVEECGRIATIQYGVYEVTVKGKEGRDDTFGAEVTYRCRSDNFQLEGEATRTCTSDGTWNGEPPKCVCVECDPVVLVNGQIVGDDKQPDSIVTYVCDTGYKLSDPEAAERTCLHDGRWSGTAPTCERVTCGRPDKPKGAILISAPLKTKYYHGDTVSHTPFDSQMGSRCQFFPTNAVIMTCNDDGTWHQDGLCDMFEILVPDWLITSHVTLITNFDWLITCFGWFLMNHLSRWKENKRTYYQDMIVCNGIVQGDTTDMVEQ